MYSIGRYVNAGKDLNDNLLITLSIEANNVEELDKLKDKELTIDIRRYSEKRSLNANSYFWKLCTMMGEVLGSDKETIYLLQLGKYGQYIDVSIPYGGIEALKDKFRYVDILDDPYTLISPDTQITARCYFGSSQYSKAEMSILLQGTINDAHDLNITTWDDEHIYSLIESWEGSRH